MSEEDRKLIRLATSHPIDKLVYQKAMAPSGSGGDQCVSCGICIQHCPQTLKIPELLKNIHGEFMGN